MAQLSLEKEMRADFATAKKVADELTDVYSSPPIPVLDIAESNGVNVVVTGFGEYNDEVAGLCDFRAKRLYVNKNDRLVRKMFTMAHEFGHWMLHRELFLINPDRYSVLPRFQKADNSDHLEQEANCFAANLLVPSRLLRPVMDAGVAWLANVFGVSREMMEYRLKNER